MAAGALVTFASQPWVNSTAASFRLWGKAISDNLQAAGLVKTSDTGQIDWTTVSAPGATNTMMGYEIYRLSDTLQATVPIYIKFEYGSNSNSSSVPGMYYTIGTGTNGAGTITDALNINSISTRRSPLHASAADYQSLNLTSYIFVLADGSGFYMLNQPSGHSTWGGALCLVERFRNFDGTPSADGYWTAHITYSTSYNADVAFEQKNLVVNNGIQPNTVTGSSWPVVQGNSMNWGSFVSGTTWYPQPVFTGVNPRLYGPSQLILAVNRNDYPNLSTFTMSHYGTSRSWLMAGLGASNSTTGWFSGNPGLGANSFIVRTSG